MFCLSLVGQFILLLWVQRVLDIFKSFVSYETHKKPICGFLFHPLPVSLGEPRFLILLKSNFSFFFSFMDYAFGVLLKKFLPNLSSQRFSSKFSPGNFTVRSITHFELFFV